MINSYYAVHINNDLGPASANTSNHVSHYHYRGLVGNRLFIMDDFFVDDLTYRDVITGYTTDVQR